MSVSDDNYWLKPLEERHAWDILSWEYPFPYDFYNPSVDYHQKHYVSQFLNPDLKFHAIIDARGKMIGFCSFGSDGQVPGGDYITDPMVIAKYYCIQSGWFWPDLVASLPTTFFFPPEDNMLGFGKCTHTRVVARHG